MHLPQGRPIVFEWSKSHSISLAQSITKGTYLNCEVSLRDLQLVQDIYGFSETRDLRPVASNEIQVPVHMRRDQSIYKDVCYFREELAIVKPFDLVICRQLPKGIHDAQGIVEQVKAIRDNVQFRNFIVDNIMVEGDSVLSLGKKGRDIRTGRGRSRFSRC